MICLAPPQAPPTWKRTTNSRRSLPASQTPTSRIASITPAVLPDRKLLLGGAAATKAAEEEAKNAQIQNFEAERQLDDEAGGRSRKASLEEESEVEGEEGEDEEDDDIGTELADYYKSSPGAEAEKIKLDLANNAAAARLAALSKKDSDWQARSTLNLC